MNTKTRREKPFYVSDVPAFDGSLLGLFPRRPTDLAPAAALLNATDWESLGFVSGGRFLFTQKSLESAPVQLPYLEPPLDF